MGRILRTVIIYAGIGALGYLFGKNANGKRFGNKVIKPIVNTIAGTIWGVFIPDKSDDVGICPPKGRLGLTPEARIDLEEALRIGDS